MPADVRPCCKGRYKGARVHINTPTFAEGPICLWRLRFIGILQEAGFPEDELRAASEELDTVFDLYSTTEPKSRDGEFAAELESLHRFADELAQALKRMSRRARLELAYEAYRLDEPLMRFSVQTKLALRDVPPDKGGPEKQATKQRLIFHVAIVWRMAFPTGKPVTRSSAGEYSGPLLGFVQKVLAFEGVHVHSKNELGKQLYEMRTTTADGKPGPPCSFIDEKAARSARKSITPVQEDGVPDSKASSDL